MTEHRWRLTDRGVTARRTGWAHHNHLTAIDLTFRNPLERSDDPLESTSQSTQNIRQRHTRTPNFSLDPAGNRTVAHGNRTLAHGNNTMAHGNNTMAHGNNTMAHGNNTMAHGKK
jgi:hypothetical protein